MTFTIDTLIIFGILYISIMGIAIRILIQRDRKIKLKKYEIDIQYGSSPMVEVELENIINSVFDEYKIMELEFRDEAYIREADEKKIIEDLCEMITQRISLPFYTRLSTYFNTESIGEVIATKVSMKVMMYRIERNNQGKQ